MIFERELLPGAWLVRPKISRDHRGIFVKTYSWTVFEAAGLPTSFREEFYSTSARDVVRGMHFQLPPYDHAKLVYCLAGAVDDVLLDLRPGASYGAIASIKLSPDEPAAVLIPSGVAHGFRSLVDGSLMVYKTTTEHRPTHDAGLRWDSFGYPWHCERPILSQRDSLHPTFSEFRSPFPSSGVCSLDRSCQ